MHWQSAALLSVALVLFGCTTTAPLQEAPGNAATATLADFSDFRVRGRIALQTAAGADSAAITWLQHGNTEVTLTLSGPLGMQATTLRRSGDQFSLQQGGETRPVNPEQAFAGQAFDWPLPLNELGWWLRGLPAPADAAREVRTGNRLTRLEQSGWTLEYDEYQTQGSLQLPRRIRFSREDVSGKLLLKDWTFSP